MIAGPARVSLLAGLWLTLQERLAGSWEDQRRHRGFGHLLWSWFWETPPESLSEHRRHVKSRAWLQDYLTGDFRKFCEWQNVAYHVLVARPAKIAFQAADKVLERQWRFWAASPLIACVITWLFMHLSWR